MKKNLKEEALRYHSEGTPGKIEVVSTKPTDSERDLSLAYSPGVAAPCTEIAKDPAKVFDYTSKGNLVAVVTNGTAVLGLGNIGPLAGKPVMEGKGVLFKQFAGINVFDIELKCDDTDSFIAACSALEPTFGGINLEDIKAPDCFIIEETLKSQMNIPVFHDDQHGTAIITAAAFLNAVEIAGKAIDSVKVVYNGAGAASIACARLFKSLGVPAENICMCDSRGVIYQGRPEGMNKYKDEFAIHTEDRSLADALDGADVFVGLSVAGAVTAEMVKTMNEKPIVFAMANPDPEILPPEAKKARPDVIIATGRTDFPNQVNNVLGFPSIFRGALDVRATDINEEMKLAAVKALAELAREDVPESVSAAYKDESFSFGPEYIIPKPFDQRVLTKVAPAVAKAAMESGVATQPIEDFKTYKENLESLQGKRRGFIRTQINKVIAHSEFHKKPLPKIVFPEGRSSKILKALNTVVLENVIEPVLIGYEDMIRRKIAELELDNLDSVKVVHPSKADSYGSYIQTFYESRQRKGILKAEAERLMADPNYFGTMMVAQGHASGLVTGATQNYPDCIRPILEIIGTGRSHTASGLNIVMIDDRFLFFADTTVNIDPSSEQIASIAIHASHVAKHFGITPKIAMLSFSNFTSRQDNPKKMREAARLVKDRHPELMVDGEMQADTAVNPDIMERIFPFSELKGGANILIFPNLDSGNMAYKLLQQLGGGEVMGPFLMGVNKPANILQRTCTVEDVINTIVLTAVEAQVYEENER
jgi:malate dehydrogenase (oxaloacetate-decarboxylating)(NADP+)